MRSGLNFPAFLSLPFELLVTKTLFFMANLISMATPKSYIFYFSSDLFESWPYDWYFLRSNDSWIHRIGRKFLRRPVERVKNMSHKNRIWSTSSKRHVWRADSSTFKDRIWFSEFEPIEFLAPESGNQERTHLLTHQNQLFYEKHTQIFVTRNR